MSDGTIYAGVGELLNFGWTWESMAEYTLKCVRETKSAARIASMLSQACDDLYQQRPGEMCIRDRVYPFGHPVCQMLRMGALRQASRDRV